MVVTQIVIFSEFPGEGQFFHFLDSAQTYNGTKNKPTVTVAEASRLPIRGTGTEIWRFGGFFLLAKPFSSILIFL